MWTPHYTNLKINNYQSSRGGRSAASETLYPLKIHNLQAELLSRSLTEMLKKYNATFRSATDQNI